MLVSRKINNHFMFMSAMIQISKLKKPPSDVRYVRLTANLKIEAGLIAYLESEAQRRHTSLDGLLEQIASEYAANKRRYKSRTVPTKKVGLPPLNSSPTY
jgi:fructose-bisphosphate aldolase class 1